MCGAAAWPQREIGSRREGDRGKGERKGVGVGGDGDGDGDVASSFLPPSLPPISQLHPLRTEQGSSTASSSSATQTPTSHPLEVSSFPLSTCLRRLPSVSRSAGDEGPPRIDPPSEHRTSSEYHSTVDLPTQSLYRRHPHIRSYRSVCPFCTQQRELASSDRLDETERLSPCKLQ